MLQTLYLTLTISALIFLAIGLLMGRKKDDHKLGVKFFFPLVAGILFGMVALSSMNITIPTCSGQINESISINDSDTHYTSEMLCVDQNYRDEGTSILFSGLALLCIIIAVARAFEGGLEEGGLKGKSEGGM